MTCVNVSWRVFQMRLSVCCLTDCPSGRCHTPHHTIKKDSEMLNMSSQQMRLEAIVDTNWIYIYRSDFQNGRIKDMELDFWEDLRINVIEHRVQYANCDGLGLMLNRKAMNLFKLVRLLLWKCLVINPSQWSENHKIIHNLEAIL